ncbi:hypothetical protein ACOSP7_014929 [Xanthoceras sorbifolium]
MENKVDVSREMKLAGLKKENLRRSCELAHAQSSSIMLLTLQWKDIEDQLDRTMKSVEEKDLEVDLKQRLLEERERVVELKESELASVRSRIEEYDMELERKIEELGSVRSRIEECKGELKCKESELGTIEKKIGECRCEYQLRVGEVNELRKSSDEWSKNLSVKREELSSVEHLIEKRFGELKEQEGLRNCIRDCNEQLELRKSQLSEIENLIELRNKEESDMNSLIQDYREELAVKEHDYYEIKKSIGACNAELESKRKKLKLMKKRLAELHSQEKKLESRQNKARRRIGSKEEELGAVKGKVKLMERQFNALCKCTEERTQELTLKQKQLNSVQESIEKCSKEFKVKEQLLMSIEESLVNCSEELEAKKKNLSSVQNTVEELNNEHLLEELELDLVRSMTSQYFNDLRQKEHHFNSLKNSLKEHMDGLEVKEKQFEERVNKFELKETHFNSMQEATEQKSKKVEKLEKQLTSIHRPQVKQPESLGASEDMGPLCPNLQSCTMGDGRILQFLMNEHLKKHDIFLGKISTAVKGASDPAKLVLDTMQGFYPTRLQEKQTDYDLNVIRRSCILLLEHLLSLSPQITPQVRDEAMKLAGEWKAKMKATGDNSLEVLGFLHLLAAFGLASDFDGNELHKLLDTVVPHQQGPGLLQGLGITNELPVNHILPSEEQTEQSDHIPVSNTIDSPSANRLQFSTMIEGRHDLTTTEVSAVLSMSPDPANFVLDLIRGSYYDNRKKGAIGIEEGVVRNYILLLERLKEVLPKITSRVKAQAMELAFAWKCKMRIVTENSLEVFGFLQLLATYELVAAFDREEILKLLFTVAHLKQAPEICMALGFADVVPDIVQNLIGRNQHIEAVRFICAFKLTDTISPESVFQHLLKHIQTSASNMYKDGNNFYDAKAANQPATAPMILPQQGEQNNSSSASSSGRRNQSHQQNSKKRPRTDPLLKRNYGPILPAPVNPPTGSPGGWVHIGGSQMRGTANTGGQQSNVLGNQYPHFFQPKQN